MTCKIERHADGQQTTFRLIGHFQAAYLEMVQLQLESHGPQTVLDLDEVTLAGVSRQARHSSIAHPLSASGSRGNSSDSEHNQTPIWRESLTTTTSIADRTALLSSIPPTIA